MVNSMYWSLPIVWIAFNLFNKFIKWTNLPLRKDSNAVLCFTVVVVIVVDDDDDDDDMVSVCTWRYPKCGDWYTNRDMLPI